ncbi:GGDEF domain-containing protein [Malaciobacter mytili]|uniref:GGDEF domain-containing protein n=1 Tax=Malaciobacter mytili TaxID=603050 RepID=UPI003BAFDD09
MSNMLKEVTFLTVKELKNEDIILPSKYSKIFENNAKKLEINFDDENIILKDLYEDTTNVNSVVKQTNENLNFLHQSTDDARVAIINKDEKSLHNIYNELAKMKEKIDFLQKELFSDTLTKAYNRKWFMDYYLVDRKFIENGALSFIDVNKFKDINNTYGHLIGDQVLKYLVSFLKQELDFSGVNVLRYAGDVFMIVFNEEATNSLDIELLLSQAQEKLANQKLKTAKVNNISFSFSYGLTNFAKDEEVEIVLNKADELMCKNKESSREF